MRSYCIAGAAIDTGNLGVSALGCSICSGILRVLPESRISIFDHGRGARPSNSLHAEIEHIGARLTRRWHQSESWAQIRLCARLGGLKNAAAKRIRNADAVLDISGGDSFTDLYGPWRFRAVTFPKIVALENDVPLLLLPQTYGPFRSNRTRRIAQRVIRGASMAWARDARSFEVLCDMLGPDHFNPKRHRLGVDVAFSLPARDPGAKLPATIRDWLRAESSRPIVGLNISGLIWHNPAAARDQYCFQADYRDSVHQIIRRLLIGADKLRILLVPHVLTPNGNYESDTEACEIVRQEIVNGMAGATDRISVVPPDFDSSEMKWIISQCDWFCGTRMHSTIAALSSGVPTASIAYSDKTRGVFETCRQGDHVADPRTLDTASVVHQILASWQARRRTHDSLARHLPAVLARAESQIQEICRFINLSGLVSAPNAASFASAT